MKGYRRGVPRGPDKRLEERIAALVSGIGQFMHGRP